MKTSIILSLALVIVTAGTAHGSPTLAQSIPAGCAQPPKTYAHTYTATPSTVAAVMATARGGDLVYLKDGAYGLLSVNKKNTAFVTVSAAPGTAPLLSGLHVNGSHWMFTGLTITGVAPPNIGPGPAGGLWQTHPALVVVGVGDNIILAGNTVATSLGDFPWTSEIQGLPDPNALSSGVSADNVTCATLYGNTVRNVFAAIGVGGDLNGVRGTRIAVVANSISNFAADGIDHYGSNLTIQNNTIWNSHDICQTSCIHTDGIQGWSYANNPALPNTNVIIDGNIIQYSRDPAIVLGALDLHGITMFGGYWRTLRITNNVIIGASWHGIFVGGANGVLIANNTLVSKPGSGVASWISAGNTSLEGGLSNNTIVRNNIVPILNNKPTANPGQSLVVDHNLQTRSWPASSVQGLFKIFDPVGMVYDLHLAPGTGAVGTGSSSGAPPLDLEQSPRKLPFDLGAYTFGG